MDKYKTWPYKHSLQRQSPPVTGDNFFKTNDRVEPFDASEKGPVKWIGKHYSAGDTLWELML